MSSSKVRPNVPGYQVMDLLGVGARSTIWRVRHRRTSNLYALKRVYREVVDDSRFINQALNEFRVARHFDHPAIRRYERLKKMRRWRTIRELHLFMELCEGMDCQNNRPTEMDAIVSIFLQVADALAHIRARGYVHADIKPNNIIVAKDGTVKIIDFGQSCRIGTVKERIQGTPDFIAPEQVHRRPLDARTDVFNFGAALYWTLTAQPIPTVLPKKTGGIQLIGDKNIPPPEELNPDVPPGLGNLVMGCIDLNPARRPQSVRELISRLEVIAHTLARASGPPPAE